MDSVREADDRHAAAQVQEHVAPVGLHLRLCTQAAARVDLPLFERLHPAHLVAGGVGDELRQRFGGRLQQLHRGAPGIAQTVLRDRLPGLLGGDGQRNQTEPEQGRESP